MNTPLTVSVVITAYNLERFIAEAVQSVFGQTRAADEIIVVNDCSTDSTREKLTSFGDRIRLIDQPTNQGALRAALRGLSEARGDVVAFLDGDDIWKETKLEKCMTLFEKEPDMVLVSHQHTRVDADGRTLHIRDETHANIDRIVSNFFDTKNRSDQFQRSILEKRGFWLGSAYSIRRSALELSAFQDWVNTLPAPEDVYLDLVLAPWVVLSNPKGLVGLVNESLFDYRIHGNNSCNDYRDIERAQRSVRRAYNTTLAADDLNQRFSQLDIAQAGAKAHAFAIAHYQLLIALYNDHRTESMARLIQLVQSGALSGKATLQEVIRVGAVVIGGPRLLLQIKNRLTATRERFTLLRGLLQ